MDWVDKPKNYKDLYGILQLLRGSHLKNFPLKTVKLGWVALHSVTCQLKCLDFQSNQYKKLVPVLSRFCNNWLLVVCLYRLQGGKGGGRGGGGGEVNGSESWNRVSMIALVTKFGRARLRTDFMGEKPGGLAPAESVCRVLFCFTFKNLRNSFSCPTSKL